MAEGDAPAFWRASDESEWTEATVYVPPVPRHLRANQDEEIERALRYDSLKPYG